MLAPYIFKQACRTLRFKPQLDLFANSYHHQVARYCSPTPDPQAYRINAFSFNWPQEPQLYANPPWPLIGAVLQKAVREKVRMMVVVPSWTGAHWYDLFRKICESDLAVTAPCCLYPQFRMRPKPRWNTRLAIIDGRRG